MKLQIKSLSGEVGEDYKKYLRKRTLWLEEHIPGNSILTVGVREHITKKSNQAFEVIFHLFVPNNKKPVYVRTFRNSFSEAVDLAKKKIERIVVKRKERGFRIKFKLPKISLRKRNI